MKQKERLAYSASSTSLLEELIVYETSLHHSPIPDVFFVDKFVISEDACSEFKLDIDRYWSIESTSNGIVYGVNRRDFTFSDDIKLEDGYRLSEIRFNVFSSKTGKWSLSKSTLWLPDQTLPNFDQSHVYVEGKLYWIEWRGMAWFDIEEDAAGIPYPHEIDYMAEVNRFSDIGLTIGGDLCYSKMRNGVTHVWILRVRKGVLKWKFEFEWEKIYTLVMERMIEDNWEALVNPYLTTPLIANLKMSLCLVCLKR
ncbi:hypothetical protein Sjap_004014 [Stephania japonica]|uniref:Uncharacterized protein n=1 Tax=Stephania japonica TaxID=461633 RepID=A0AAP0K1M7_9MAGN